jgi:hypothetical protein
MQKKIVFAFFKFFQWLSKKYNSSLLGKHKAKQMLAIE